MQIKRCPYCMGPSQIRSEKLIHNDRYLVFVECDICGYRGKSYISDSDPDLEGINWENQPCNNAIEAWNMRSDIT